MALIPVRKLIEYFQQMYREQWAYEWGAAQKGCVDCSGAFVYVWRLFNKTIAHGSNKIARSYIKEILPISEAKPGMAALKRRKPGDEYYDLPDKYQPGGAAYNGDLNDYYHVGLVDDDPRYVLNAQGKDTGFQRSPISKWFGVGYLKDVDYGTDTGTNTDSNTDTPTISIETGGNTTVGSATVIQPAGAGGTKVHIRKTASTGAPVVDDAPFGAIVDVLDTESNSAWYKIKYKGKTGWMMRKFLDLDGEDDGSEIPGEVPPEGYTPGNSGYDLGVTVSREWLESIRDTLDKYLGVG